MGGFWTSRRARRALAGTAGALLALLCAAAGAEPVEPEEPVDRSMAELGQPYFVAYCASCHGSAGRGDGPAAESLKLPPADLTRIAARRGGRFPSGEIAQFIDGRFELAAHGSRQMPIWGDVFTRGVPESDVAESISRGKVLVLVEYLKSIQVPPLAAQTPPSP
jgi:mono/diheme cytochrome c family protein